MSRAGRFASLVKEEVRGGVVGALILALIASNPSSADHLDVPTSCAN